MQRQRGEFGELRERRAHLEGLLEGLREVITGRLAKGDCFNVRSIKSYLFPYQG